MNPLQSPTPQGRASHKVSLLDYIADLSSGRECSEPLDYIYAMLGLTDNTHGIVPDYELSFRSVVQDFATRMLLDGNLSVLHKSGLMTAQDLTLPSFVPNVTRTRSPLTPLS